jgi:hypothetical protein
VFLENSPDHRWRQSWRPSSPFQQDDPILTAQQAQVLLDNCISAPFQQIAETAVTIGSRKGVVYPFRARRSGEKACLLWRQAGRDQPPVRRVWGRSSLPAGWRASDAEGHQPQVDSAGLTDEAVRSRVPQPVIYLCLHGPGSRAADLGHRQTRNAAATRDSTHPEDFIRGARGSTAGRNIRSGSGAKDVDKTPDRTSLIDKPPAHSHEAFPLPPDLGTG